MWNSMGLPMKSCEREDESLGSKDSVRFKFLFRMNETSRKGAFGVPVWRNANSLILSLNQRNSTNSPIQLYRLQLIFRLSGFLWTWQPGLCRRLRQPEDSSTRLMTIFSATVIKIEFLPCCTIYLSRLLSDMKLTFYPTCSTQTNSWKLFPFCQAVIWLTSRTV